MAPPGAERNPENYDLVGAKGGPSGGEKTVGFFSLFFLKKCKNGGAVPPPPFFGKTQVGAWGFVWNNLDKNPKNTRGPPKRPP